MTKLDEIRQLAEGNFLTFVKLVAPHEVWGRVHEEVMSWMTREDAKSHQMVLLPRAHKKSRIVAYWVAWEITRNPATTVLYVSSTSNLAEKQLKSIKDILGSRVYSRYWPEMVNEDETKRERWTASEISVDHPKRKAEGVRDPTVFTAGLTSGITGLHCEIAVLDDVVVQENAYTRDGRETVKTQYSLLASIENPNAREKVVGTRYHPADLYGDLIEMTEDRYDENGEVTESLPVFEVFERQVEDSGDGNGEFLWPRQQRKDGKWFGFNQEILAKKRAQYLDKSQFRGQYYNDPNDPGNEAIKADLFQYYDRRKLELRGREWYFDDRRLRLVAAMDFAYTLRASSDYTTIVVLGADDNQNYFVIDIDRFKTNRVAEYAARLLKLHERWGFGKVRMETTAAQSIIANEIKVNYILPAGIPLTVDTFNPTGRMGSKEERVDAILRPRYEARQMWHYKCAAVDELEQELKQTRPKHDDVKDALAMAVSIAAQPGRFAGRGTAKAAPVQYHGRFGGVR